MSWSNVNIPYHRVWLTESQLSSVRVHILNSSSENVYSILNVNWIHMGQKLEPKHFPYSKPEPSSCILHMQLFAVLFTITTRSTWCLSLDYLHSNSIFIISWDRNFGVPLQNVKSNLNLSIIVFYRTVPCTHGTLNVVFTRFASFPVQPNIYRLQLIHGFGNGSGKHLSCAISFSPLKDS